MYKDIIVDTKNYNSIFTYSMMSGKIPCTHPIEIDEIAHRVMKGYLTLRMDNPNSNIYLALDSKPYWRTGYLEKWYDARPNIQPVVYKGNRGKSDWILETPEDVLMAKYAEIIEDAKRLLGFKTLGATGLEADDIWGLMSTACTGRTLGISTDHDWAQCCMPGKTWLHNPIKGTTTDKPIDMNPYYLGGDTGDGIKGCPKYTKKGDLAKNGWGIKGATKHVDTNPDSWRDITDQDHIEKNIHVMKLPCPDWDVTASMYHLFATLSTREYVDLETAESLFKSYSLPASLRKRLSVADERKTFINNIRGKLQEKLHNKEAK